MPPLIKLLGSLRFAIILISGLALVLVASTLSESYFGTPFVQKTFYQAGWFDLFLALFAVCIVCSTLTRFPYQRKHTGFVLTHIGILLLLGGSLWSRLAGAEGQMLLYEGEKRAEILQSGYEFVVHRHGGAGVQADFREHWGRFELKLDAVEKGLSLSVPEVSENTRKTGLVQEGSPRDPENAAVRITLASDLAGFSETFWLVEKDPADPSAADKAIGPARIVLQRRSMKPETKAAGSGKTLFIRTASGEKEVDLDALPQKDIDADGYQVRNIRYYPDARVAEENRLINVSEKPLNPAVEFEVAGPDGKIHRVVNFALFPDFQSMHERADETDGDFKTRLEVSDAQREIQGPALVLTTDGERWHFVSRSSKDTVEGDLIPGAFQKTGWMDFRFKVEQTVARAVLSEKIEPLNEGKGDLAAHVRLQKEGAVLWDDWLIEEQPRSAGEKLEGVVLVLRRKSVPVPFSLELKDFRKVDYPGTGSAMAYESDVSLEDAAEKTVIQKTISMNKPLDYKGYRIFQSSFVQSPDSPEEASVFTIAKNPGILWIYAGAVVLFAGVFILFFIKPLSSFNT